MRTFRTLLLIPVLLALLAGTAFAKAPPQRAGLDPSFGRGGAFAVTSPEAPAFKSRLHLAVAPSNKSYVLRGDWIVGFGANGRPDPGFGGNGRVQVIPQGGALVEVADLAVDSQGRVLVTGTLQPVPGLNNKSIGGEEENLLRPQAVVEAFVIRYLPNGSLDPTFGRGGEIDTTFGAAPPLGVKKRPGTWEHPVVEATQIAVDAADQPVIAGKFAAKNEGCFERIAVDQAFVARLNADGSPDAGFGSGGTVRLAGERAYAFAAATGGWVALGGPEPCQPSKESWPYQTELSVLTESGSPAALDPGHPTLQGYQSLAVDAQGGILYNESPQGVESVSVRPRIIRLLPDGDLDSAFGKNGSVSFKRVGATEIGGIALDQRGRIVVGFGTDKLEIGRASATGKLETKFGDHGVLAANLNSAAELQALAVDSKGRIVAAGEATGSSLKTGYGIAIARFLPGG